MSVAEALVEWRTFYSAVAEAGGTLLGLVFVGITIHLGRHPLDLRTRALGLGAILALLHPLLVALTMLLPVAPAVQGMICLVIAASGLVATVRIFAFEARHRGRETRFTVAYRYFLPLAAEVILAFAGLGLVIGSRLGLYGLPVFLTLMVIVGTQDAVDLLFGTSVAGRPGDGLFQIGGDEARVAHLSSVAPNNQCWLLEEQGASKMSGARRFPSGCSLVVLNLTEGRNPGGGVRGVQGPDSPGASGSVQNCPVPSAS
jgi:hypothetical protein